MDALAARALGVTQALLALGNEVTTTELGAFVANPRAPKIWDANHVAHPAARTRDDVDRLLVQVEERYAGLGHRRVDLGHLPSPILEARLADEGYAERRFTVMMLDGALRGRARALDIRPIADAAAWTAFATLRARAWEEEAARLGLPAEAAVAEEACLVYRAKTPPLRWWLAWEEGVPCGYFASWEGNGGLGQVEDLFVHRAHRHRGIATALVHHCVRDCRTHGAGPVLLVADPNDTPREMYSAMGFVALTERREYLRRG